ncbi:hypothetical protein [uncultured Deinococcus sp.]|uniref:hypothetical protein n=1 Tax=uncultured Deinococcus sp. TaxID=158789 RepID=UPI00374899DF
MNDQLERAYQDSVRENKLLRDSVGQLQKVLDQIVWREGQEGDGYRITEKVHRAQIMPGQKKAYDEARRVVRLALSGKSPEDEAREAAQRRVEDARQKLRAAEAELQAAERGVDPEASR